MVLLIWLLALTTAGTGATARRASLSPECASDADCVGRFPHLDRSRCDPKGKRVITMDLNGDGRPDTWKYYAKAAGQELLTCTQRDLNFDGTADISSHFDARGGRLIEELDLDFDGQPDRVVIFRDGKQHTHTVGPGTACVKRLCTPSAK